MKIKLGKVDLISIRGLPASYAAFEQTVSKLVGAGLAK